LQIIPVENLLIKNDVYLHEKVVEIGEAFVSFSNLVENIKQIGFYKRKNHGTFRAEKGHQMAVFIENPYKETGLIKNVLFKIRDKGSPGNGIRIRFFSVLDGHPNEDILDKDIILSGKKIKKKMNVDVSEFDIFFPKNGVFAVIEWICMYDEKDLYMPFRISVHLNPKKRVVYNNYYDRMWIIDESPINYLNGYIAPNLSLIVGFMNNKK